MWVFNIASLKGSYNGEAWRSTAQHKFRLKTVGTWAPYKQEGSRPIGGPYAPGAEFSSAHYFDVRGATVAYAWRDAGARGEREVRAKPMSAAQQRFLARLSQTYRPDPATRGLCLLIQ